MFYSKRPAIILCLVSFLSACANSPNAKNLEQLLAADPRLQTNPPTFGRNTTSTPSPTPTSGVEEANKQLPQDFPTNLPIYPGATLQEVITGDGSPTTTIRWQTSDPSNAIVSFYQRELKANNWEITTAPNDDGEGVFTVKRDNQQAKISIQPKPVTNPTPNQPQTTTEIKIEYTPTDTPLASTTPGNNNQTTGTGDFISPLVPQPSPTAITTVAINNTPQQFTDIGSIPQPTQGYIQDLARLGVIPVRDSQNKTNQSSTFQPSKIITRSEYAHWLVLANNALHANRPDKQIRLADTGKQPVFKDVPQTHPDFPFIQGLAEAGLIPSPLSGDTSAVLFRPDAPLVRETLLQWKVPLDHRQALPSANLNAIQQTWGFQDATRIDPKVLSAVLADYQSGEKSNIRRVFGYTTILQPKQSVTRTEAAIALWYFGTQTEGISAREASKLRD